MQRNLALKTPDQHGEGLHPSPRHGTVLVWQRQQARRWIKISPTDPMAQLLSGQVGQTDRYITVNDFHEWRLVKLLRSLRAVYVDLDRCSSCAAALLACEDANLPAPSYAVESGRGVHLYWLLESTPGKALPVWQAIQKRLIDVLQADPACSDCTRVLRLAGTINSKNGAEVLGYEISPQRWTLHELANEVLGYRPKGRATVTGIERARSMRAVQEATGVYQLWHSRYLDLCTVADHWAFMRGMPEGNRDLVLFHMANALSWFTRSESLPKEIERVGRTYTPTLTLAEVREYTAPIVKRALQAANGQTKEWNGEQFDPRYRYRTDTLREQLAHLIEPVEDRLRVLVPRHVLDARKLTEDQARIAAKRRAAGVAERSEYLAQFEESENAQRPWEALGISRATYFRRKQR